MRGGASGNESLRSRGLKGRWMGRRKCAFAFGSDGGRGGSTFGIDGGRGGSKV